MPRRRALVQGLFIKPIGMLVPLLTKAAMGETDGAVGGYLIPPQFSNELFDVLNLAPKPQGEQPQGQIVLNVQAWWRGPHPPGPG
jgi:hypothetical protein